MKKKTNKELKEMAKLERIVELKVWIGNVEQRFARDVSAIRKKLDRLEDTQNGWERKFDDGVGEKILDALTSKYREWIGYIAYEELKDFIREQIKKAKHE